MNAWVALVTLAALAFYFTTALMVGRARHTFGVAPPAITGPPEFDRTVRVQANTLEWLVMFVPALWLFAAFVEPRAAAALGVVWIAGRILYARGYVREPKARTLGFLIQAAALLVLALGALGGAVWSLVR